MQNSNQILSTIAAHFPKLLSLGIITAFLFLFNACTDEPVTNTCSISISTFSLSSGTVAVGGSLTGSIVFTDNVGLDALTARSVTDLYLSTDDTYNSSDTALDLFTNPATLSGSTYTVAFNQIDIPFGIATGTYYIIARIEAQPCTGSTSSNAVSKSKQITVN